MRAYPVAVAALVALAGIGTSCSLDPVHAAAVDDLGGENAGEYPPESAYHRPGQSCGVCHSEKGPADSTFVLSGTVYWGNNDDNAKVDNAYVRIIDAKRAKRCFVTNCNGNFYVRRSDFPNITYPILLSVERTVAPGQDEATLQIRRMSGHLGREGSCAACHIKEFVDFASPGRIRMFNTDEEFRAKNIPLVACPPPPGYVELKVCPEDAQ